MIGNYVYYWYSMIFTIISVPCHVRLPQALPFPKAGEIDVNRLVRNSGAPWHGWHGVEARRWDVLPLVDLGKFCDSSVWKNPFWDNIWSYVWRWLTLLNMIQHLKKSKALTRRISWEHPVSRLDQGVFDGGATGFGTDSAGSVYGGPPEFSSCWCCDFPWFST